MHNMFNKIITENCPFRYRKPPGYKTIWPK
jgi:hypothetical protein